MTSLQVFEDNLDIWMEGFRRLLTMPDAIKALFAPGDDDEKLSSMHAMQRSVCEAILLYADKVAAAPALIVVFNRTLWPHSILSCLKLWFCVWTVRLNNAEEPSLVLHLHECSRFHPFKCVQYIVIVDDSDNRSARVDERPVFQKHLGTFVEAVWGLLTQLGVQPQFDKVHCSKSPH